MTVATTHSARSHYTSTAKVEYAYDFKVMHENDLLVYLVISDDEPVVLLELDQHYAISGVGELNGGAIIMTDFGRNFVGNGNTLYLIRNSPFLQETKYIRKDVFPSALHEAAMDIATLERQELKAGLSRTIQNEPWASSKIGIGDIRAMQGNIADNTFKIGLMESAVDKAVEASVRAEEEAQEAKTAAGEAKAAAEEAKDKADSVSDTAEEAKNAAAQALTIAQGAEETASGIAGTAQTALTTAQEAKATAEGISGTANSALSQAQAAVTKADDAADKADNAVTKAETAAETADNAATTAGQAKLTADTAAADASAAKTSAAGAQADIDAHKSASNAHMELFGPKILIRLTANLTLNVGLSQEYKTIQAAVDAACTQYDFSIYTIIISVDAGEYNENVLIRPYKSSGGFLVIQGASESATIVNGCFYITSGFSQRFDLYSSTIRFAGSGSPGSSAWIGLFFQHSGYINLYNLIVDPTADTTITKYAIWFMGPGKTYARGPIAIKQGRFARVLNLGVSAYMQLLSPVSLEDVTATTGVIAVDNMASFDWGPSTAQILGTATGPRVYCDRSAQVDLRGAGQSAVPGTSDRTPTNGGLIV